VVVVLILIQLQIKATHLGKLRQDHFLGRKVSSARRRMMLGLVSNQGTDELSLVLLNL